MKNSNVGILCSHHVGSCFRILIYPAPFPGLRLTQAYGSQWRIWIVNRPLEDEDVKRGSIRVKLREITCRRIQIYLLEILEILLYFPYKNFSWWCSDSLAFSSHSSLRRSVLFTPPNSSSSRNIAKLTFDALSSLRHESAEFSSDRFLCLFRLFAHPSLIESMVNGKSPITRHQVFLAVRLT